MLSRRPTTVGSCSRGSNRRVGVGRLMRFAMRPLPKALHAVQPLLQVEVDRELGLEAQERDVVARGHVAGDVPVVGEAEEDRVRTDGVVAEGLHVAEALGPEHADELDGAVERERLLGLGGLLGPVDVGDLGFGRVPLRGALLGLGGEDLRGGRLGEVGRESFCGVAELEARVAGEQVERRDAASRGVEVEVELGVGDEGVRVRGVELAARVGRAGLLEAAPELAKPLG
mmetsp:Transcript_26987/g.108004  ORF Transcript_26987/g.108004 Transcript_26987/m.108004 type:complete len:229 (-) Transcript_26987:1135-1821(-)